MPNHYDTPFLNWLNLSDHPTDFLEERNPASLYFAQQGNFGQGRQRRYFENQFNNFYNQYLGRQAQQVLEGETPTQRFADFAGGIDFDREYRSLAPSLRGESTSRFAPFTRFLNF